MIFEVENVSSCAKDSEDLEEYWQHSQAAQDTAADWSQVLQWRQF